MNVLEKYSVNCGVKISRPVVASSYFPLVDEKYIILDGRNKYKTNVYELFPDVLAYLQKSFDNEGIKVYAFNDKQEDVIMGTQPFINLTRKQEAYLIKNSLLALCGDNVTAYYAAALGVPCVALYSAYPAACTAPIWGDLHTSIESDWLGNLPAYGVEETPKAINFIHPEKIANTLLRKLNLGDSINIETVYIGDHYPTKVVEVIPDFVAAPDFLQGRAINLRADYHYHEERVVHWLQGRTVNLLVNEPINLNLLKYFQKNIVQLTVNINEKFSEQYLKDVVATGVPLEIFCENKDELSAYRFKFFDFDIEESIFKSKKDLDESLNKFNKNTRFLSGKILISDGEKYSCLEAKKQKNVLTGAPEIVYDTKDFWKELDHYRLFNNI